MTIKITKGNLLKQDNIDAIVNTVNCVGVMGKGIALQFKNKWPMNYRLYEAACKKNLVKTGKMFIYDSGGLLKPNYIINFPTKNHWREKSKIEYIQMGLDDLIIQISNLKIKSIAIPPLGCGNGGLDWTVVKPIIEGALKKLPELEVFLYEPSGSPSAKEMEVSTTRPRMTNGRAAILKLIETYREIGYGLSKIEVQKLAYFLQQSGEQLGLNFVKNTYGPYSEALRHSLNRMEGHFIVGLGDGVVDSEIAPLPGAVEEAERYLNDIGHAELFNRVDRISSLIEGFQSPYGMELLATVHWVATNEVHQKSHSEVIEQVHNWNPRKKNLMAAEHIQIAFTRLKNAGWLENQI